MRIAGGGVIVGPIPPMHVFPSIGEPHVTQDLKLNIPGIDNVPPILRGGVVRVTLRHNQRIMVSEHQDLLPLEEVPSFMQLCPLGLSERGHMREMTR